MKECMSWWKSSCNKYFIMDRSFEVSFVGTTMSSILTALIHGVKAAERVNLFKKGC